MRDSKHPCDAMTQRITHHTSQRKMLLTGADTAGPGAGAGEGAAGPAAKGSDTAGAPNRSEVGAGAGAGAEGMEASEVPSRSELPEPPRRSGVGAGGWASKVAKPDAGAGAGAEALPAPKASKEAKSAEAAGGAGVLGAAGDDRDEAPKSAKPPKSANPAPASTTERVGADVGAAGGEAAVGEVAPSSMLGAPPRIIIRRAAAEFGLILFGPRDRDF